jgi:hypothetical protein
MANSPVDRDKNYMKSMWGTSSLITDYWSLPRKTKYSEERVLQEIMHDDLNLGQKNLNE